MWQAIICKSKQVCICIGLKPDYRTNMQRKEDYPVLLGYHVSYANR